MTTCARCGAKSGHYASCAISDESLEYSQMLAEADMQRLREREAARAAKGPGKFHPGDVPRVRQGPGR